MEITCGQMQIARVFIKKKQNSIRTDSNKKLRRKVERPRLQ